jgi:HSP20 family protein
MTQETVERAHARSDALTELLPRRWMEWLDWPLVASMRRGDHLLRVEEFRKNGDLVIRAEMPGIDPDKDVDVQVRDHVLEIRAERTEREEHEGEGEYRSEFHYGSFFRAVTLPPGAKEADIKAGYHDGILEVRVPVAQSTEPAGTRISVEH